MELLLSVPRDASFYPPEIKLGVNQISSGNCRCWHFLPIPYNGSQNRRQRGRNTSLIAPVQFEQTRKALQLKQRDRKQYVFQILIFRKTIDIFSGCLILF